jgi:hypothetical protein
MAVRNAMEKKAFPNGKNQLSDSPIAKHTQPAFKADVAGRPAGFA